ncbi:MAG: hypothetical protein LBC74_14655 [Planctomycetaceae bacterium]|jgi:hypothetical protein|nr:hypothetical protein [Planctomycetaceae bacterium]
MVFENAENLSLESNQHDNNFVSKIPFKVKIKKRKGDHPVGSGILSQQFSIVRVPVLLVLHFGFYFAALETN